MTFVNYACRAPLVAEQPTTDARRASAVCLAFTGWAFGSDTVPTPDAAIGGNVLARTSRLLIVCALAIALPGAIWTSASGAIEPSAFQLAGGGGLSVGLPVNVVAGQGAGALGTVTITLPDGATAAGDGWAAGDVLSLDLASDPAGANAICDGTLTAPTVTATSGATTPLTGITLGTSTQSPSPA
jgi:hypothetical protein